MRKSKFQEPKLVLVFNGAKILTCMSRSLRSVSDLTGFGVQALASCCTGKTISSYGYYFRYVDPDVIEITQNDIGSLSLDEFDKMCGENRTYHTVREMSKKRKAFKNKQTKQDEGGID